MTEPAQAEPAPPPARPILLVGLETEAAAQIVGDQYEVVRLDQANGHCKDRPVVVYWHSGFGPFPPEAKPLLAGAKVGRVLLADVAEPFGPAEALAAGFDLPKLSAWAKSHGHDYAPEIVDAYTNAWIANVQAEDARRQAAEIPGIYEQIAAAEAGSAAEDDAAGLALQSVLEAEAESSVFSLARDREAWPEPIDLWNTPGSFSLPLDCLPAAFQDHVPDEAELIGIDPGMYGMQCLGVAGGVAPDYLRLQPKAADYTYTQAPRLWIAVVGESGTTGKSAGLTKAMAPAFKRNGQMAEESQTAIDRYSAECKAHEQETADWARKSAKKDPTAGDPPPKPAAPEAPQLVVGNFTMESLSDVLFGNGRRGVLAVRDEVSSLITGLNQYKGGAGTDRQDLLQLFDGGRYPINRRGRRVVIEEWSASILGGIQPSSLANIVAKLSLDSDGLLQRFTIYSAGIANEGIDRRPDEAARERYQRIVMALPDLIPHQAGACRYSPEAQAIYREAMAWVGKTVRETTGALSSHIAKWRAIYPRLCLIYHAIDCADRDRMMLEQEIPAATAARAWGLMRSLWPQALAFYETLGTDTDRHERLHRIAGLILVRRWTEFNMNKIRENYRRFPDHYTTSRARHEFLEHFELLGWTRRDTKDKTCSRWIVNPAVHSGRFEPMRAHYATQRAQEHKRQVGARETAQAREPGVD